jgi:hypothetical protein
MVIYQPADICSDSHQILCLLGDADKDRLMIEKTMLIATIFHN